MLQLSMMKTTLASLALVLGLFGCSGEHKAEPAKPSCEATYATCEWEGLRIGDEFFAYFKLEDCSYDYGICIGQMGETECEMWCDDITWVPSSCISPCDYYKVKTSTVS